MLTVVISIATQTVRQAGSLEEFSEAFIGRVNALASAYTLLSRDNWTRVPLRDVLEEELRPFASPLEERFVLEGEAVLLLPRAALAFGMIFHELVTNAVKHGALSVPDGRITLLWQVERQNAKDHLAFAWTERDGPNIGHPLRKGFGLALIERSARHELKGEAVADWQSDGLSVTLKVPLEAVGHVTARAGR
ncbi:MAG: sensor histidine kinase [Acetobacteraceae bacterium]